MQIFNNITAKKVIIPAVVLASSITVANIVNQKNNISAESTLEYMNNDPISQGTKAGLLGLFGIGSAAKRRKEMEKDIDNILSSTGRLEYHLYFDEKRANKIIDNLIEKINKNAVNTDAKEAAIKAWNFIKENGENLTIRGDDWVDDETRFFEANTLDLTLWSLYPKLFEDKPDSSLTDMIMQSNEYIVNANYSDI